MRLYRLGEEPNYEPDPTTCIGVEASTRGVTVLEAIYAKVSKEDCIWLQDTDITTELFRLRRTKFKMLQNLK